MPASRYEEAELRYKSVGEWLGRENSSLRDYSPEVYVQGSFRLGTPIKPVQSDEHYDIDLVCELHTTKKSLSQEKLKKMLGDEMQLYASAQGMKRAKEGRRCWTLEYAEGAQFHLDALPAIPDGERKRLILEAERLSTDFSDTAIAITDIDHVNYRALTEHWPHSNPKGYTAWFRGRMRVSFEMIREAMALSAKANVEDIPTHRVKTPLQKAVQILKRHRDVMFLNKSDQKPISVIITTLAALSCQNEPTVGCASINSGWNG